MTEVIFSDTPDFTFIAGEKRFIINRARLSCASPVFEAILQDKECHELKLDDIHEDVAIEIFKYIYTPGWAKYELPESAKNNMLNIIICAFKYDLSGLLSHCENAYLRSFPDYKTDDFHMETILDLFQIADKYHMVKLLSRVCGHIVKKINPTFLPDVLKRLSECSKDGLLTLISAFALSKKS